MHGWWHRGSGCERTVGAELLLLRQHMFPVPSRGINTPDTTVLDNNSPSHPTSSCRPSTSFFLKDGRKILVGDCALFQAGKEPPFIGLIHSFKANGETFPTISVTWLYRPSDVNLAKGIPLDAAPNEIFYSFHKDVISAASLLHPCKVAFLRQGDELPAGTSSFVCWRVYDIDSRCFWWLTDQDYINDRQEEIDWLLDKGKLEMHASVQSGGRSPKLLNGTSAAEPSKSSSDTAPNCSPSFSAQSKGKRKERGDLNAECNKREHVQLNNAGQVESVKNHDGSVDMKVEIFDVAEKGGLKDTQTVEKVVKLMQQNRIERAIDLKDRLALTDIISATDEFDCLSNFVQLGGVTVLDEWLQEAHKGKTGEGISPKESDKVPEDVILALLRALDKLPVNLTALQACQIGKSVNHLRSHKNLEIQKKARSLVDTWKMRVAAEWKTNDTKTAGASQTVTLPANVCVPDRKADSSNPCNKSPSTPTFRAVSTKAGQADCFVNLAPAPSGLTKLQPDVHAPVTVNPKDFDCKPLIGNGTSDILHATAEEKKNITSTPFQNNNSLLYSGDHAKSFCTFSKEDARTLTSGSSHVIQNPIGSSRHKRLNKRVLFSGNQSENTLGKSGQAVASNKTPHAGATLVKTINMLQTSDEGANSRIIVKLPNPDRSPVRNTDASYLRVLSVDGTKASSSGSEDRQEHGDSKLDLKPEVVQSDVSKDVLLQSKKVKCTKGTAEGDMCLLGTIHKGYDVVAEEERNSFISINALIEICNEVITPPPTVDDLGMNLLASVAIGEISASETSSPFASPIVPSVAFSCVDVDGDVNISLQHNEARSRTLSTSDKFTDVVLDKHIQNGSCLSGGKDPQLVGTSLLSSSRTAIPLQINEEHQCSKQPTSRVDSCKIADISADEIQEQLLNRCALLAISSATETDHNDVQNEERSDVGKSDVNVVSKMTLKNAVIDGEWEICSASEKLHDDGKDTLNTFKEPNDAGPTGTQELHVSCQVQGRGTAILVYSIDEIEKSKECSEALTIHGPGSHGKCSDFVESKITTMGSVDAKADSIGTVKVNFDLNEGILGDDVGQKWEPFSSTAVCSSSVNLPNHSTSAAPSSFGLPCAIAVPSPAKRPFVSSENFSSKSETRWKGTATTSAFRPAEPRKVLEIPVGTFGITASEASGKQLRPLLKIDLNVADERVLNEVSCSMNQTSSKSGNHNFLSSRLNSELCPDLNTVDADCESGQCFSSVSSKVEVPFLQARPQSNGFSSVRPSSLRDFDLNNGPGIDNITEPVIRNQAPRSTSNMTFLPSVGGAQMHSAAELGNVSSWLPASNTYTAVAVPPFFHDRGEQSYKFVAAAPGSQKVLNSVASTGPYIVDYRGPILSSPAMAFSSAAFPYGPFGTSLPVSTSFCGGSLTYPDSSVVSSCFPTIAAQFVGTAGGTLSHFPRPYLIKVPEGGNNSHESMQRWSRQALDLNMGPASADMERKDEILSSLWGQNVISTSPGFLEEQARVYHVQGAGLRRKEPEGLLGAEKSSCKNLSWQ